VILSPLLAFVPPSGVWRMTTPACTVADGCCCGSNLNPAFSIVCLASDWLRLATPAPPRGRSGVAPVGEDGVGRAAKARMSTMTRIHGQTLGRRGSS